MNSKLNCKIEFFVPYNRPQKCLGKSLPPPPLKKSSPLSKQPPLKIEIMSSPPLFLKNLVGDSTPPPAEKWGGGGGGRVHTMSLLRSENVIWFFAVTLI